MDEAPTTQVSADQIAAMWEKVNKDKLVQYKLKVDLAQDVMQVVSNQLAKDPQSQAAAEQKAVRTQLEGKINDGMLKDTRLEERKELPEVKLSNHSQNKPFRPSQSLKMEEVKEQDSEVEAQSNFSQKKPEV